MSCSGNAVTESAAPNGYKYAVSVDGPVRSYAD